MSLHEQKEAIERYAKSNQLEVSQFFEEQLTAAKRGRPLFGKMLKLLRAKRASGVIIHKIDRSARNLKDWADLGELTEIGIEVHFANESLDMNSRGGRLSADIQAVIAADYIRNLREETKKGFYGRLKQGLYPMPAPLGYLNQGKGLPKTVDPQKGLLVKAAFHLYASGKYNLKNLNKEMYVRGLRGKTDKKLSLNALSLMLNNPFYMGLIKIKKTGQTFAGSHHPLVSSAVFKRVQNILSGRTNTRTKKHNFTFRRFIRCSACKYHLIGETHKGWIYYRCHNCIGTTVREDALDAVIRQRLGTLVLSEEEIEYLRERLRELKADWMSTKQAAITSLQASLAKSQDRLARLTDAFLDQQIEKDIYEERKMALLWERRESNEKLDEFLNGSLSVPQEIERFLELIQNAPTLYKNGLVEERRDLLQVVTSNFEANKKSLVFGFNLPFSIIAERMKYQNGSPPSDMRRTFHQLAQEIWDCLVHSTRLMT